MRSEENDTDQKEEDRRAKGSSSSTMQPLLDMRLPTQLLVCSARCTGKTNIIASLAYHLAKTRFTKVPTSIIVFAGTKDLGQDYNWLPKERVRQGFNEKQCMTILRYQMKQCELKRRQAMRANVAVNQNHLLLILDDVYGVGGVNIMTSPCLKMLSTMGRHYYTSVIMSIQSSAIGNTLRQNTQGILFSKLSQSHLKHVWEATRGMEWKEFLKFTSQLNPYEFGYFDNASAEDAAADRFHVVKADSFPRGRFFIRNKEKEKNQKTKKNTSDTKQ